MLAEQGASSQCNGNADAGVSTERQDFLYLYGMPVAVLFSSPDLGTPDCGKNFIVPNHLGTPVRLLDSAGNTSQSPEPRPYGGMTTNDCQSLSYAHSDVILAYDQSTNDQIPFATYGAYTDPSSCTGTCPQTVYTNTIFVPGASALAVNLNVDGIDPCADAIVVAGNGLGDTAESLTGTGAITSSMHPGNTLTVALTTNPTLCGSCGGGTSCTNGTYGGGSGYTIRTRPTDHVLT